MTRPLPGSGILPVTLVAVLAMVLATATRPHAGSLSGVVRDAANSAPVAGALLTFVDPATGDTVLTGVRTGSDGRYVASLSVGVESADVPPAHFNVGAPYPNPVASGSPLTVPVAGVRDLDAVSTEVFDVLGRRVAPGAWLAPGAYFVAVRTPDASISQVRPFTVAQRMTLDVRVVEQWPETEGAAPSIASKSAAPADVTVFVSAVGYVPIAQTVRLDASGGGSADFEIGAAATTVSFDQESYVGSATVDGEAVTLVIDSPGFVLDGFGLAMPERAYPDSRTVHVSYAPVVAHRLDPDFEPASVAVRIDMGGGYADSVLTLTLPATIPSDAFPVVTLYDEATGEVELLPLEDYTEDHVTVVSRHFQRLSGSQAAGKSSWSYRFPAHVIVFSIKKSKLEGKSQLTTGFEPGTDSFEFANFGSHLANGGHCAGQSLAAMWYYYEKRLPGGPPLSGLLDPTKGKMFSTRDGYERSPNRRGYRWASVLQEMHLAFHGGGWDSTDADYATLPGSEKLDRSTWLSFVAAFVLTGEPQLVTLFRPIPPSRAKKDTTWAGHAVVAYGVDLTDGTLLISDPNFPDKRQVIRFDGSRLAPYSTKQNAGEVDKRAYPRIRFFAKTALLDWEKIGKEWLRVQDGSIGNPPEPAFDQARLQARIDGSWIDWFDGLTVVTTKLPLRVDCSACLYGVMKRKIAGITVFDSSGVRLADNGFTSGTLKDSVLVNTELGEAGVFVAMYSWSVAPWDTTGKTYKGNWLDFTRITWKPPTFELVADGPGGVPISVPGEVGSTYSFTVKGPEGWELDPLLSVDWDWGDGESESWLGEMRAEHAFASPGTYVVRAQAGDPSQRIFDVTATVQIEAAPGNNSASVLRTWTVDPFYLNGLSWQAAGQIKASIDGSSAVEVRTGTMPDGELGIAGTFGVALDAQSLRLDLVPGSLDPVVMETTDSFGDRVRYTISAPFFADPNDWVEIGEALDVTVSDRSLSFSYEFWSPNEGWGYGIPIQVEILEQRLFSDGSVIGEDLSRREVEQIYVYGVEQTTSLPF